MHRIYYGKGKTLYLNETKEGFLKRITTDPVSFNSLSIENHCRYQNPEMFEPADLCKASQAFSSFSRSNQSTAPVMFGRSRRGLS